MTNFTENVDEQYEKHVPTFVGDGDFHCWLESPINNEIIDADTQWREDKFYMNNENKFKQRWDEIAKIRFDHNLYGFVYKFFTK